MQTQLLGLSWGCLGYTRVKLIRLPVCQLLHKYPPMTTDKYSVIMPTYNEKDNLPIITFLLFEQAKLHSYDLELVIIEDSSPDGTYEVALGLQKIYPDIIVHKRPGKMGLGSAYQDGIKFCTGNFVILMDADLSHHPKYIIEFIKKQKETGAEVVTGTRYIEGAGVYGWNFHRKLTSRVANFLASTVLGTSYSDLTGSFRLYKKQALASIINQVISKGYAFQMQILIRAGKKGYRVEEVPIVFVDRLFGSSKLGANEIKIYLKGVYKLLMTF